MINEESPNINVRTAALERTKAPCARTQVIQGRSPRTGIYTYKRAPPKRRTPDDQSSGRDYARVPRTRNRSDSPGSLICFQYLPSFPRTRSVRYGLPLKTLRLRVGWAEASRNAARPVFGWTGDGRGPGRDGRPGWAAWMAPPSGYGVGRFNLWPEK